jgi:hypothetical protein
VQRGAKLPQFALRILDSSGNPWRKQPEEAEPRLLHHVDGLRVAGRDKKVGKFERVYENHSLLVLPEKMFTITGAPGQIASLYLGLKPPKQQGGRQQGDNATPGGAAQQAQTQQQVLQQLQQQLQAAGMPPLILSQFRLPAMHSSISPQRWEEMGCIGDPLPSQASQPSVSHASLAGGTGQQQKQWEHVRVYILDNSGYLKKYHPAEQGPWQCNEQGLLGLVRREGYQVLPLVAGGQTQEVVVLPSGKMLRWAASSGAASSGAASSGTSCTAKHSACPCTPSHAYGANLQGVLACGGSQCPCMWTPCDDAAMLAALC